MFKLYKKTTHDKTMGGDERNADETILFREFLFAFFFNF